MSRMPCILNSGLFSSEGAEGLLGKVGGGTWLIGCWILGQGFGGEVMVLMSNVATLLLMAKWLFIL